ncbi:hypothetical protein HYV85_04835 [Candidatus Woesearchaeota archaeon]|nr:hypothetical protein [Candidatus Woesearchaeota archaeon]
MNTCTIILPIDRKRSMQLLVLLQMFGRSAVIPIKEITKAIPKSTFFALLYRLRLIGKLVSDRYGFDLFLFEKLLDLDSRKQVKAMKLNADIDITELEGNSFVVFSKALQEK